MSINDPISYEPLTDIAPSRASLLLTDIVDSTQLTERLGDERMAHVWHAHDRMARDLLPLYEGREIDKTDGMLLLFQDPHQALEYAIAYHRGLKVLSERERISFLARAGLHVDVIQLRENSADDVARGAKPLEVEGLAKSLVARVMSLGRGGQTLASGNAVDVLDRLPCTLKTHAHGHFRLKGIYDPVPVYEVGVPNESPFAPPIDTPKAYQVVQRSESWVPVTDVPNNLPSERNKFQGRDAELRELSQRIQRGQRLITLLGPGGTGKSRLSLELARRWRGDWAGGTWLCELEDISTKAELIAQIASTAQIALEGDDPVGWLGFVLAQRQPTLFVIDNFEQLVGHADVIGRLVKLAPNTMWLVSSRERLQLSSENVFRLGALHCPVEGDSIESIMNADAVRLFSTRASASTDRFTLDERNAAAVGELVGLLDGMPLAIELAAARATVMSPQKMVARMTQRFKLLSSQRPGVTRRRATLRGAIDWSWELIAPWERLALAQCSVFRGGFTLDAAEGVLNLDAWDDAPWPADVVQGLVDKSLLRTMDTSNTERLDVEEPLLGMYQSIRDYADEKLRDPDAIADPDGRPQTGLEAYSALRLRHTRHFSSDLDGRMEQANTPTGMELLAMDRENLSAAFEYAVSVDEINLAASCCAQLTLIAFRRGTITPVIRQFDRLPLERVDRQIRLRMVKMHIRLNDRCGTLRDDLIDLLIDDHLALGNKEKVTANKLYAITVRLTYSPGEMIAALQEIEQEFDDLNDPGMTLSFVTQLLFAHQSAGHVDEANELMRRMEIALCQAKRRGFDVSKHTYDLAQIRTGRGEFERALELAEQLHRFAHDERSLTRVYPKSLLEMLSLTVQVNSLVALERWDESRDPLIRGRTLAQKLGYSLFEWGGFVPLITRLNIHDGELDSARELIESSIPVLTLLGEKSLVAQAYSNRAELLLAKGEISQARSAIENAYQHDPDIATTTPWTAIWLEKTMRAVERAEAEAHSPV